MSDGTSEMSEDLVTTSRAINCSRRLGSATDHGLRTLPSAVSALILTLGSIRGSIVIHSDAPGNIHIRQPRLVPVPGRLRVLLHRVAKEPDSRCLKNLLAWNRFQGIVNVAIDPLLDVAFDPGKRLWRRVSVPLLEARTRHLEGPKQAAAISRRALDPRRALRSTERCSALQRSRGAWH